MAKSTKVRKKILLGLLAVILLAQFFQPSSNKGSASGPTDISQAVSVPDSIQKILSVACYDCHSNHTNYPWYSRITPVNWWLRDHITDGKKELNFSEFANYNYKRKTKKFEEIAEEVEHGEMPLKSYLWIHDEARLTDGQRKSLISWAKASEAQMKADSLRMPANMKDEKDSNH